MDRKMVNFIKEQYPPGTRIRLNSMEDPYHPILPGTEGEVDFVDDKGQIFMKWDNGRTLPLAPGEDSFTVPPPQLSRPHAPAAAQTAAPDMHDAENALDYQGTYTGVFPAADVPGIAVTLTLGSDGRYTEVNRYCERPGQFTDSGRYTVRGNILTLRPDSPKDIPAYYRVGENRLWRLDSHQQPITGPFADQYILTKSDSATPAGCY